MSKLDSLTDAAIVEMMYRIMQMDRLLDPLEVAIGNRLEEKMLVRSIRVQLHHLRDVLK